jgi:hypothetical protein
MKVPYGFAEGLDLPDNPAGQKIGLGVKSACLVSLVLAAGR